MINDFDLHDLQNSTKRSRLKIKNFKAMSLRDYIHQVKTHFSEELKIVAKIITFLIDHKYMTNNISIFKALLKTCPTYQNVVGSTFIRTSTPGP